MVDCKKDWFWRRCEYVGRTDILDIISFCGRGPKPYSLESKIVIYKCFMLSIVRNWIWIRIELNAGTAGQWLGCT